MKKVLVLGSTGLVGSALVEKLKGSVEVVEASFNHAENPFDISNPESLKALFEKSRESRCNSMYGGCGEYV
ncbi:hypothetical protein JCM19239_1033 [Vibrio variabilis]|uniref:NAD-dependent epimerase/dehydratase domain-containing protein n=1 Tax=Vibrio variabilis TaxID=990271 RepID=A0ABQ0JFR7_9VIBR|nr:hypothetical protein JCM19239_1033 [Vibrio variabilis]